MVTRIFVDANTLYSRTIRDWVFMLKLESGGTLFTVATSLDVVAEWLSRYRDRNPQFPGSAVAAMHDRVMTNIDERVDDFTVDDTFSGNDVGDAHVDAAARACGADMLVTADRGWLDMPAEMKDALAYEVYDADDFFCLVHDSAPSVVAAVTSRQLDYWYDRNGTADLPRSLRAAGCTNFAGRVREVQLQLGWRPSR